ncbi:hypothetical protein [Methylobacter sp. BlB1]|uniref:hypothetical protein n=1 Tax=Methylobacter sp. BlB1 TaxID=2785914 RepID=UPI0018940391|nr:hypothetical protein [Methylobacter sp. BlB1]MBF6647750.1 hypothetical protein [Methylobacter sp. BlB1]
MNEEKKKPVDPEKYPSFFRVYPKDVNLKFVFDNLRNYGIAAFLFYTGILILKNGTSSTLLSFPYAAGITSGIVMASALVLAVLNFLQGIVAMVVVRPWRMIPYILIAMLLHIVLFEMFFQRGLHGTGI